MMHNPTTIRTTPAVCSLSLLALLASAPAALGQCGYTIQGVTTGTTGLQPWNSAVADFNHDGNPDLLVTSRSNAAMAVHAGTATAGFFGAPLVLGAGAQPDGIVAGDFNGDGWVDAAVTGDPGFACVFMNNAGTFAPVQIYPTAGTGSSGIVTADFNGDGTLDLAISESGSGVVSVLMGNGLGQFGAGVGYSTGGVQPRGLTLADMNNDGRPDLVVVNTGSGTVRLLTGNPGGTFTLGASVATGIAQPWSVAALDLQQDGDLDLVVGGAGANPNVSVLNASAPGVFAAPTLLTVGTGPAFSLRAADMNIDGRTDVVVAAGSQLVTLLALANGTFTSVPITSQPGLRGLTLAVMTGDGQPDAVAVSQSGSVFQTFWNLSSTAPVILQQPVRAMTAPGMPAAFSTWATTGGTPQYRWWKDDAPLPSPAPGYSGVTTPTLTILNPTLSDNLSIFRCVVQNGCEGVSTRSASLGVVDPCGDSDFNGDGDFGTDADIEAFFRVLGGGGC